MICLNSFWHESGPFGGPLGQDCILRCVGVQTYERSCIQKWLESGKRTCPKTGSNLPHSHLTPNHVLRSVIAEWCTLHGIELPKKRVKSRCSAEDKAAIDELVAKLQDPSPELQRSAAHDIRLMAKMDVDHRICIAEQGAIPLLVGLLLSPDEKTQEHAVTALLNLSINDCNKGRIVSAGMTNFLSFSKLYIYVHAFHFNWCFNQYLRPMIHYVLMNTIY